ncbi:hypothetical protein BV20DRAFT_89432 [Pilatotrama ljubarskyi]|nr:hypothetical protein BV20DRAFT_89432 [Pilatotrama ljubarskyi]
MPRTSRPGEGVLSLPDPCGHGQMLDGKGCDGNSITPTPGDLRLWRGKCSSGAERPAHSEAVRCWIAGVPGRGTAYDVSLYRQHPGMSGRSRRRTIPRRPTSPRRSASSSRRIAQPVHPTQTLPSRSSEISTTDDIVLLNKLGPCLSSSEPWLRGGVPVERERELCGVSGPADQDSSSDMTSIAVSCARRAELRRRRGRT